MMKKSLLYLLMAVFALNFISCKDDDEAMIPAKDLNTTFGASPDATLILNYSNNPVIGKQVTFNTENNKTATLTLLDVIPGQSQTIINNVQLVEGADQYTFNGSSVMSKSTAGAGTIAYSGSIKKGELNLSLNVTMPDPKGWVRTYNLGDYKLKKQEITASPLYIEALPKDKDDGMTQIFRAAGALILPQLLQSVNLETDGNICANYSSLPLEINMEKLTYAMYGIYPTEEEVKASIPTEGWVTSPKNLVYWFEREGKLYVKMNLPAIIAQATKADKNTPTLSVILNFLLNGDAKTIKAAITGLGIDVSDISDASFELILGWLKNGIPFNVSTSEEGHVHMFLDKETLNPLMVSKNNDPDESDIVKIWTLLIRMELIPEDAQIAGVVFQGIAGAWPNLTTFNLGLDLK